MASVLSSNPALQNLKITFHESTLISPSQETENRRSFFLGPIDQILNYNIPTVHFFEANADFPPETVAKRLKLALGKVLVEYDFMAGRLKVSNDVVGRLEIECNRAGAGFVVASSEYSLEDLGDFVFPNVGFRQLAVQTLDNLGPGQDQPLCVFQVTSFKCGGFAIGVCTNHILFDGISAVDFFENLASQAFDDGRSLATVPSHDRRLLSARTPPHVDFDHPEFFKPERLPQSGVPIFDCVHEDLDYKVFKLPSKAIEFLKDKAKNSNSTVATTTTTRISSFSAVTTLIWRCKAMSLMNDIYDDESISMFLNVVDVRQRVDPPLPPSYCGNGVLVAYTAAKRGVLRLDENWPELVEMVSKAPVRVNDEYVRSAIDYLEINRGLPYGEYMVSSWLRLRFDQVAYPWGKPVHSGPVVSHRKDICWVFACAEGAVNALVSLPPEEIERFESSFRGFFHDM